MMLLQRGIATFIKERLTFVSLFRVKCSFQSGAPKTVFWKISVRGSKYRLEFSIAWQRLNIYRRAFHSGTIFEALLSKKFPTIFLSLIFLHFTPVTWANFLGKWKYKIFGFKNVIKRGIRKILNFIKRSTASRARNNFRRVWECHWRFWRNTLK